MDVAERRANDRETFPLPLPVASLRRRLHRRSSRRSTEIYVVATAVESINFKVPAMPLTGSRAWPLTPLTCHHPSIPNSPLEMTPGKNINTCFRVTHPTRRKLGILSSIRSALSTGCRSITGILRRCESNGSCGKEIPFQADENSSARWKFPAKRWSRDTMIDGLKTSASCTLWGVLITSPIFFASINFNWLAKVGRTISLSLCCRSRDREATRCRGIEKGTCSKQPTKQSQITESADDPRRRPDPRRVGGEGLRIWLFIMHCRSRRYGFATAQNGFAGGMARTSRARR